MITFDEMSQAIDNAKTVIDRAKMYLNKMANFIIRDNNMRQLDTWTLCNMKRQLRNYDMVKKQWKS